MTAALTLTALLLVTALAAAYFMWREAIRKAENDLQQRAHEQQIEQSRKSYERFKKQAEIVAEHRDIDDVLKRLRDNQDF